MWKTGHSLIKDKMRETGAPIAGEMSGHMFFTEGFYGHDDAMYGAARLLRILADSGRTVQADARRRSAISCRRRRFASTSRRSCKFGIVERAVKHFRAMHDVIDVDGVRVLFGDGWGLIRASNTQPVLVARYEAQQSGAPRGDPRRDGGVAARAGRHASEMTTRRWLLLIVAVVAIVLIAGRALAGMYADYLWYESLGAAALVARSLGAIATMRDRVGSSGRPFRVRKSLRSPAVRRVARISAPFRKS